MNMSEDVTAVSMQVSEKAAEAALSAFKSVLDSVGRLFRELLGMVNAKHLEECLPAYIF